MVNDLYNDTIFQWNIRIFELLNERNADQTDFDKQNAELDNMRTGQLTNHI